jgi:molybdate/tungstate transport system substrate-binding protein
MANRKWFIVLFTLSATLCACWPLADVNTVTGELMIFHAGSLAVPFRQIAKAFENEYPGVQVRLEAAGSRESARKISDLGRHCDIMASADYAVIDTLLIPAHASWNIKFAGNEMVIAFTEYSRGATEINQENWHEVLMRADVFFGRSDPNSDPCGYRTLLTAKLAEKHCLLPGFSDAFAKKRPALYTAQGNRFACTFGNKYARLYFYL